MSSVTQQTDAADKLREEIADIERQIRWKEEELDELQDKLHDLEEALDQVELEHGDPLPMCGPDDNPWYQSIGRCVVCSEFASGTLHELHQVGWRRVLSDSDTKLVCPEHVEGDWYQKFLLKNARCR